MITLQNITKRYDQSPLLSDVTFSVPPGRLTLLTGVNGAGKSTTLRILAGLTNPDSGTATIAGCDIVRSRRLAQTQLSFLPQGTCFQPVMTPWQLMNFYAGLRALPRSRIEPLLERVGLSEARHKPARQLSGGMVQRLGIALLLLPDAPVLILDEPGISLDPAWRDWLRQTLEAEAARGKTVLITTHLLAEWHGVSGQTLICSGGRVHDLDGETAELASMPARASRPPAFHSEPALDPLLA